MRWFRHGRDTDVNVGVRELQRRLGEANLALASAETHLIICIERLKEVRRIVTHDEVVLAELRDTMKGLRASKVTSLSEYQGLRRSIKEIEKTLSQRRQSVAIAEQAVTQAAEARDNHNRVVSALQTSIQQYRVVIPWKTTK